MSNQGEDCGNLVGNPICWFNEEGHFHLATAIHATFVLINQCEGVDGLLLFLDAVLAA